MADKWVVDADYPHGHLVPMTPAEEAQLARDRKAGAAASDAQAAIEAEAASRTDGLRKARADLAAGVIFASLSAKEKSVIELLLQA